MDTSLLKMQTVWKVSGRLKIQLLYNCFKGPALLTSFQNGDFETKLVLWEEFIWQ